MERRIQQLSFAGQVIEDLTCEPLSPGRFEAELVEVGKKAHYKTGGFFAFSNLRPNTYTIQISGQGFQTQWHTQSIPFAPPIFEVPGDNDLIVIVKTIDEAYKKITFAPIGLKREIKEGSSVHASGFSGKLNEDLPVGKVEEAKLDGTAGLSVNSIVRIMRDKSIRLKFDPYSSLPFPVTRVVGEVVNSDVTDMKLERAEIRLQKVNGVSVSLQEIAGAKIALLELAGKKILLGTERDITTFTNDRGHYNLYFIEAEFLQKVTLRVTLSGYQSKTKTVNIGSGERKKIDFQLRKS